MINRIPNRIVKWEITGHSTRADLIVDRNDYNYIHIRSRGLTQDLHLTDEQAKDLIEVLREAIA